VQANDGLGVNRGRFISADDRGLEAVHLARHSRCLEIGPLKPQIVWSWLRQRGEDADAADRGAQRCL
jgi:hypothetical protein